MEQPFVPVFNVFAHVHEGVGSLASHSTSFAKVMKLPPRVSFEKGKEGNFSGEQLFTRLWYRLISRGFNVVQTITHNSVTFEYPSLSLFLLSSSSAIELIKIYDRCSTNSLSRKKNLCGEGKFARVNILSLIVIRS